MQSHTHRHTHLVRTTDTHTHLVRTAAAADLQTLIQQVEGIELAAAAAAVAAVAAAEDGRLQQVWGGPNVTAAVAAAAAASDSTLGSVEVWVRSEGGAVCWGGYSLAEGAPAVVAVVVAAAAVAAAVAVALGAGFGPARSHPHGGRGVTRWVGRPVCVCVCVFVCVCVCERRGGTEALHGGVERVGIEKFKSRGREKEARKHCMKESSVSR